MGGLSGSVGRMHHQWPPPWSLSFLATSLKASRERPFLPQKGLAAVYTEKVFKHLGCVGLRHAQVKQHVANTNGIPRLKCRMYLRVIAQRVEPVVAF